MKLPRQSNGIIRLIQTKQVSDAQTKPSQMSATIATGGKQKGRQVGDKCTILPSEGDTLEGPGTYIKHDDDSWSCKANDGSGSALCQYPNGTSTEQCKDGRVVVTSPLAITRRSWSGYFFSL